jgi:2-oxo-hept-3-ene-1,7-dioate hydratase
MATTLTAAQLAALATQLETAEQTRQMIRPASSQYPGFNMDDAYAVQAAWIKHKLAGGQRRVLGHKIGLTSRAMQMQANIRRAAR